MNNPDIKITLQDQVSENEVVAELTLEGKSFRIFFQSPDVPLTGNLEAWLSFSLLPAMLGGNELQVTGPVSQRFLEAMPIVQDIYANWYPYAHRVEIKSEETCRRDPTAEGRVGCFFSGGVDSWYTFLKHQEEITDLIFVHGLDIRLDDLALYQQTLAMIQSIADSYEKRVLEVKTNLRSFTERRIHLLYNNGAALAGIGHALSEHFRKIYIAATHTYSDLIPMGSHPILDPLWRSEALEFVHDGCEADRMEKVELISRNEIVLQTLRVCWKNTDGAYNCGKCEKCLRTMIELSAVGALERCATFTTPIDLRLVARIPIHHMNTRRFVEGNLRSLESRPEFRRLSKALRQALKRSRWEAPLHQASVRRKRQWRENSPRIYKMIARIIHMVAPPPPRATSTRQYWKDNSDNEAGDP